MTEPFRLTSPYAANDPKAKRRKIGHESTAGWAYFANGEAYVVSHVRYEASTTKKLKINGEWVRIRTDSMFYSDSLEGAYAFLVQRINAEVKIKREEYDRRVSIRDRVLKEQKTALKMGELPPSRYDF